MGKTALIKISLIDECDEVSAEQVEGDILKYLNDCVSVMPWKKDVVTVKVLK
jgi:hypothetical protein